MMRAKQDKYGQLFECSCSLMRKTARKITQLYDDFLRDAGIKTTQFSILAMLANLGDVPLTQLADEMGLERTGLTRNLNVLKRNGWIRIDFGDEDSRQRIVSLTEKGYELLDTAIPYWERAQRKVKREMGAGTLSQLHKTLNTMNIRLH